MNRTVRNAIIRRATLSNGDHGMLSSFIDLDFGGSCQGFGGHCLHNPEDYAQRRCGLWVWRILQVAGVTEWSKLPGRTVRVEADDFRVYGIGHIINDDWFFPEKEFIK